MAYKVWWTSELLLQVCFLSQIDSFISRKCQNRMRIRAGSRFWNCSSHQRSCLGLSTLMPPLKVEPVSLIVCNWPLPVSVIIMGQHMSLPVVEGRSEGWGRCRKLTRQRYPPPWQSLSSVSFWRHDFHANFDETDYLCFPPSPARSSHDDLLSRLDCWKAGASGAPQGTGHCQPV